ncbi:MAG TPA: hypothetical protein VMZ73_00840 [Acidimicrobiales bacterium]|nr:hypothetical protein [Acidimicrobiales bacterium]
MTENTAPRTRSFAGPVARIGAFVGAGVMALSLLAGPASAAEPAATLRVGASTTPTGHNSHPCNTLPEYCEPDAVDNYCLAQLKNSGVLFGMCRLTMNLFPF